MKGVAKGVAVLGSTGSIGMQTLEVVRSFPREFRVVGLAARRSFARLKAQVEEFRPSSIAFAGAPEERAALTANGAGAISMESMAALPEVDVVVSATVGDVGLPSTLAGVRAGKRVVLANKESIVLAGTLIMQAARESGAELLPADSEPNAIWQCLRGEDATSVARIIITASGGAFRDMRPDQLDGVTPEQALRHPTWKMGPKITIDSATLMNKAFEVMEAKWLFGVDWDDIEVVIHPQSLVHSMVEFADGSVKAQLSPPDMRLPLQYALLYPRRLPNRDIQRFDAAAAGELTFRPLPPGLYPCFDLAMDVAKRGGAWPAALSGADEAAVSAFLGGRLRFTDIPGLIERALAGFVCSAEPGVEEIIAASAWGKRRAAEIVGA